MSKEIYQFRYYNDNDARNQPFSTKSNSISRKLIPISKATLSSGAVFRDYSPIICLEIQTLPGVKFYLNDPEKENPIVVGNTGIYELNIDGLAQINSLQFDSGSLKTIMNDLDAFLIINIIYNKE